MLSIYFFDKIRMVVMYKRIIKNGKNIVIR